MDNSRIPKKVLDRKYHGRRPVGRPRLRWEDIRRDLLLLDGGDGQGIGISGGELLKRPWPDEGCHAIEEEEELCNASYQVPQQTIQNIYNLYKTT
jgi:hypothetical protein